MKKPKEMDPTQTREKVESRRAKPVCVREDEPKCDKILLEGERHRSVCRAV